jgi:hypothetical protein
MSRSVLSVPKNLKRAKYYSTCMKVCLDRFTRRARNINSLELQTGDVETRKMTILLRVQGISF